jgi:hypothetical protein
MTHTINITHNITLHICLWKKRVISVMRNSTLYFSDLSITDRKLICNFNK